MKAEILYFFIIEISTGNTLEISDISSFQNLGKFAFFWRKIAVKNLDTSEISTVLPVEISASKNLRSQLSLEKNIRSKEQIPTDNEQFLCKCTQNS